MTDELARVKPKSFHDKNAHPERYCVAIGCLEYEPCSIHLGPRITDDELARVRRIGKPASVHPVLRQLFKGSEDREAVLRAQNAELLAALRELHKQSEMVADYDEDLVRARDRAGVVIAKAAEGKS